MRQVGPHAHAELEREADTERGGIEDRNRRGEDWLHTLRTTFNITHPRVKDHISQKKNLVPSLTPLIPPSPGSIIDHPITIALAYPEIAVLRVVVEDVLEVVHPHREAALELLPRNAEEKGS